MPRLFDLPYIPNRTGIQQRHRNLSRYKMLHRFAYTETMSGLRDDIPTLLFYAPFALLKDTCEYLCRMMTGSVEDMIITPSQERQDILEAGGADHRFKYRFPHDGKSLADDSTPHGNYLQL